MSNLRWLNRTERCTRLVGAAGVGSLLIDGLLVAHELHLKPADVQRPVCETNLERAARVERMLRNFDACGADGDVDITWRTSSTSVQTPAMHERDHQPA